MVQVGAYTVPAFSVGDCLECLWALPDESVQCIVTSPPYWRKRGYDGSQIVVWGGNPDCDHVWEWRDRLISAGGRPGRNAKVGATKSGVQRVVIEEAICKQCDAWAGALGTEEKVEDYVSHCLQVTCELQRVLKPDGVLYWNIGESYDPGWSKSLVGVTWHMGLGLVEQGWLVRNEITWCKTNNMPFSGTDRLANAAEPIFMCVKNKRYKWRKTGNGNQDVWRIPLQPWKEDHYAHFPPELVRRCLDHATDPGDLVLDPFAGSGTTLAVADCMGLSYLGFDVSEHYVRELFPKRLAFVRDWWAKRIWEDDPDLAEEECA